MSAEVDEVDEREIAIRTVDLRVDYGDVHAVRDVSLEIKKGEVYGLIGPNGAGKTSTIRVLATLQEPTYGDVFVAGIDVIEQPRLAHRELGYMPDFPPTYDDLQVWEFLDLFAAAYGIAPEKRINRVGECIEMVNLTQKRNALCAGLSRGMKQRLVLAKTLLHDPAILILDEPASGLDPMARIELRGVVKQLAERGKTIIISSHILTELSDVCTSIGIMEQGRLLVSGTLEDVVASYTPHKQFCVELLGAAETCLALVRKHPGVESVELEGLCLTVQFDGTDEESASLLAALVKAEIPVKEFYRKRMDVEDVFMKVGARTVS